MTWNRPSRAIVVAGLGASCLVMLSASTEVGGRATVRPERLKRTDARTIQSAPPLAAQPYGIPITYYSVRGNLDTRLTLNNKGPAVMKPTITLYARDGRRHRFPELAIGPHAFVELDLRELAAVAGEGFDEGSLRVTYTARPLELGGMLRMTDLATGVEFDEQLMYPATTRTNRLEGVWWLPNEATQARLIVTNATGVEADVTVRFAGRPPARTESLRLGPWQLQVLDFGKPDTPGGLPRDGRLGGISIEYTGEPGGILARGLVLNAASRYSAVIPFADPAEARTSTYQAGGVRVAPIDGLPLEPVIVARNTGGTQALVTGRLQVTGADSEMTSIEIPAMVLGPGETTLIDARDAWDRAAALTTEPVGLELEHDGAPGAVVLSAASVSQNRDHVFRVPLTDPPTLPSATGGYFWHLEGTRNILVFLKNMTDEPQRYNLILRYAEGGWAPGLKVIPPRQSVVIDIGAIRANQVPDAKGRTIPAHVSSGQVHWSIGRGTDRRGIVGRVEQVDLANGVSSTYACPAPTTDIYESSWIEPSFDSIPVSGYAQFTVWEQDRDAFTHELGFAYEITDTLYWQSFNPNVAASQGVGWFIGTGAGYVTISASGQSNGWESYEEEGGAHVSISEYAEIEVQQGCPTPTNFRIQNVENYGNGLEFHYRWDSTSGNVADLWACTMRERVVYPGFQASYTFPSPPFAANDSTLNPYIEEFPATDGEIFDRNTTGSPFVQPYSSVEVVAGQEYQYRCSCSIFSPWVTIDTTFAGIAREFSLDGSFWRFELRKSGFVRTLYPLP